MGLKPGPRRLTHRSKLKSAGTGFLQMAFNAYSHPRTQPKKRKQDADTLRKIRKRDGHKKARTDLIFQLLQGAKRKTYHENN
jgi:hypothetical protein